MSKKIIQNTIVVIIIAVIAAMVAIFIQKQHQHKQLLQHKPLPKAVKINTLNQPTIGNPKSNIHIVAFEDFKCANCKRYSVEIYPQIKKAYIDTQKAQYTFINLAFLPGSSIAATTARCLYTQKNAFFFEFADYLYHHQGLETDNWITIPTMLKYANTIKGVNPKQLETCLIQSPFNHILKSNMKIAESAMGNEVATPSVYINGILVSPLSFKRFQHIFNEVSQQ